MERSRARLSETSGVVPDGPASGRRCVRACVRVCVCVCVLDGFENVRPDIVVVWSHTRWFRTRILFIPTRAFPRVAERTAAKVADVGTSVVCKRAVVPQLPAHR